MGAPIENEMLVEELAQIVEKKQKIADKWNKVGFFRGMEDNWSILDLALVLENQRLSNEEHNDSGSFAAFKRISIPLVYRIWKNLIVHELASVQPLFHTKDNFYHLEREDNKACMKKDEVTAAWSKMKACWTYEAQQDGRRRHVNNLDAEAELTCILAQEITLELDRRCLTDMRNNAGTVSAWDFNTALGDTIKEKYESLYIKIHEVGNVVDRKTGRGEANWVVTSPEIASIFETACSGFYPAPSDAFTSSLGIQYVGKINNKWKLYKDPLFPTSQILLGYKGNHPYDAGYFWMPCVMLKQTPTVLDPDSFCPRNGIMTQSAKRLANHGEDFYARIGVANFII